ncbi:MAG TPA: COX15/CtaA family protein, partial [Chloroflexota bacterium]|nr:COX15/CtaA family protein [Chloroflexota bacterium]
MTDRTLKRLSIAATFGMFVVLVMGATVTSTGSGEGCGRSWPLCNGEFIPEFALSSLIEYSHRLVTGIEGLLIAVLAIGVWRAKRSRLEIQILVPVMVGFLLLQAGLGAAAVVWPQEKAVLALHFGISLVAFASVFLTAVFLHQTDGRDSLRDRPVPIWFRRAGWGSIVYVYGVVYLGAYIRHTKTSLACFDWPLCNGYLFPGFSGPAGIAFAHRLAALGAVILVA